MDILLAAVWTILIGLISVAADIVASKMVYYTHAIRRIREQADAGIADDRAVIGIRATLEDLDARQSSGLILGADLAAVALSLDFAALGVWITNHSVFPFFSRFNSDGVFREIPIWFIVGALHVLLLLFSVAAQHYSIDSHVVVTGHPRARFMRGSWFRENSWMLAANVAGFTALFTGLSIVANAF